MNERFYTPKQVAEILQVHQYTVLKWIREGKLRALKFGRVYRTTESEIKSFLGQTAHDSAQDIVRAAASTGFGQGPTLEQVTLPIPNRMPAPEHEPFKEEESISPQPTQKAPAYTSPSYQPAYQQPTAPYNLPTTPQNFTPKNDQVYSLNIGT